MNPAFSASNFSQGVETLPFSLETFRLISKHLSIHSGISRVINRADVGVISTAEVEIRSSSPPSLEWLTLFLVYHCRSSNMWKGDLALSVTHCVKSESTFGMLFGCTAEVQEDVINRLKFAREAIMHPLLLPGIFVELERNRHVKDLVEKQMVGLETTISDLTSPGDIKPPSTEDTISLWLDTTALRNGLTNWKEQIRELICHLDEFALRQHEQARGPPKAFSTDSSAYSRKVMLENTSRKIRGRLASVVREYEENIRDCNMRIEGVAMATQLLHAKTNMEIAVDAKRDGKRIQNISLFSVIFLPSMFVATIFSTDFFNWFPGRGEAMISPHIWILFTFCLCVSLAFLIGYVLVSSRISCNRKRQFIKRGCDVFV
ncbi:cyclin-dependent kinase-like 4 [Colletotrichum asianum]|uniref:Cyclin-dependent kinase-like 4 n=1 Tax=Colletotrichum asianum TaxID=702518 RepID=A0A8H3WIC9_9PEZI|nr:cyclin-dependent kinase-like 4 [Colletotrichum asianum]